MVKNILVIDDEKSVQKAFILALSEMPYHIDVADNNADGLQQLKAKQCDRFQYVRS